MAPSYEFLSVSLEIVAFFFVTIDLYGRKRLEAASDALVSMTKRGSTGVLSYLKGTVRVEMWGANILEGLPVAATILFFLATGVCGFLVGYIGLLLGHQPGQLYAAVSGLLGYLGFSGGIFSATVIVLYLFCGIVVISNRCIQKIKFEGVLLTIGAVLFVAAKGMIWAHLLKKLWQGG